MKELEITYTDRNGEICKNNTTRLVDSIICENSRYMQNETDILESKVSRQTDIISNLINCLAQKGLLDNGDLSYILSLEILNSK